MEENKNIALVLTGTIKPTTDTTKYKDWKSRRREYLESLNYYSSFGKIYFLENSDYDLENDKEFINIPNVVYRKFSKDKNNNHNIGYQEFKMLDDWILNEENPPSRWIKLSGRYIIENFAEILNQAQKSDKELIMDLTINKRWADTYLFCIDTSFYKKNFAGIYVYCAPFVAIESVLYDSLCYYKLLDNIEFFKREPLFDVISSKGYRRKRKGKIEKKIINTWRAFNFRIYPSRLVFFPPFYIIRREITRIIEIKFKNKEG
ncbi:hypothetical protein [Megasphaera hominis]|jgi:hypothetical protein|uniref:Uncharacterized protein n=1 Tax=Megasphaera hominis TaxID=159836 RepID=A0ABR6VLX2_9FIRM|nr:hypothetical protein [Megasphaera hominis]MBC3537804.1 hypothetical protein [Megasphaera hominis]